jgi:hypothetical protein
MAKAPKDEFVLEIQELQMSEVTMHILGSSPMIQHRFPFKAWQELLLPSKQKNRAELEGTLKHDPINEFRESLYRNRDKTSPAMFHVPNAQFHSAIAGAAIDIAGAKKAVIERLTQVTDVNINLFGVPQFFMAMVRNSGFNATPDVRTRPIFPEWACAVTLRYMRPNLTERVMGRLAGAGGKIRGIGDWRPEKGGPYGTWDIVSSDNPDYRRILSKQGRAAQQKAWDNPVAFDIDSEELFAWYQAEIHRREMDSAPIAKKKLRTIVEQTDGSNKEGVFVGVE